MKWLILIILVLLLSLSVGALVAESTNYKVYFTLKPATSGGNITTIINPTAQNSTKGHLYIIPPNVTPSPPSGGTGGPSGDLTNGIYYDVIVDMDKKVFKSADEVKFRIIIMNRGDIPDKDAVLQYYLVSPTGVVMLSNQEVFAEVKPTCTPNGQCFTSEYIRTLVLPKDAPEGEWKVEVKYETQNQQPIQAYNAFKVDNSLISISVIIIILLSAVILFLIVRHRRKQATPEIVP